MRSVAVLPFGSDAKEAGALFVTAQIVSRVIDGLARIPAMRVLAYSTVKHVRPQRVNPQRIGKELGVRGVISGELLWQSDDLLLHIELIDAADGTQIWGAHLRRRCESLIECAEQFAQEILRQLHPVLDSRRPAIHAQATTLQPSS